jgi:predicted transcriptional regulator
MLGVMNTSIPSPDQVRKRLAALGHADIKALADKTGAPFTTLWKIRAGDTTNPRIDTVRAIWPELIAADKGAVKKRTKAAA